MFSKKPERPTVAPPAVLVTPATACEDGGRCSRMDFVLEAQHVRQFLTTWGREGETHKHPFPPCLQGFRLSSKAAKYVQRFAERDTSSRLVLSDAGVDGGGNNGSTTTASFSSSNCCGQAPSPLTELAWWFSEALKKEKPERRVIRYFFGAAAQTSCGCAENNGDGNTSGENGNSNNEREALDFLYSLIWQLVKAFPHGQTSPQGVVVNAFPKQAQAPPFTVDQFREKVSKLDGTMATFDAGLDLLKDCVQVAGHRITYVFDGLEPIAQGSGKKVTGPPRGYDPVLRVLFESSASKVHNVWVTTKAAANGIGPSPPACQFQKDTGCRTKEFALAPTSSDLLLRSWRTVDELKFKGSRN
ncbi:uncharacterized protein PG998_004346 [Apiospora kogelbergensis]|uniref:uncharacterized protein n=1 Tax=Apiospora kogelbergensis TaxID=1337665 RepID=UPI003132689E